MELKQRAFVIMGMGLVGVPVMDSLRTALLIDGVFVMYARESVLNFWRCKNF